MIEITNTTKGPIQLLVRSKKKTRAFTTLILPGRGSGHHTLLIEDERATKYISRVENMGLIRTRHIEDTQVK
jgi:hypothetical protein